MKKEIDLGYVAMYKYKPTDRLTPLWLEKMHEDDGKPQKPVDPNETVLAPGNYDVVLDHPFNTELRQQLPVGAIGMTRRQLVALIVKLYRKASKNPKKYGIWAHCFGDLMLHTATLDTKTGNITVSCDS
jgi:hypothetical protein